MIIGVHSSAARIKAAARWLEGMDPGSHRRIKGLRLVAAYGIAANLGTLHLIDHRLPGGVPLGALAGGFALWACVSEGQTARAAAIRDLALLCAAAALGAAIYIFLAPRLQSGGLAGPELTLVTGAFLVGYLRRFGVLGAGIGSQIYIGQLLAYGIGLGPADLEAVAVAGSIAALAAIVPRLLGGLIEPPIPLPAPVPASASASGTGGKSPELVMGLQAASAALTVVALNETIGLAQSAWAISACTYVVAASASGTAERVRRRIAGTLAGVPVGLACLPLAAHAPLLIWTLAAIAMIIYAMALPERYDIACAAFAFTLIVTLAVSGPHPLWLLAARAWETLIGGVLGAVAARFIFPLRPAPPGS